MWALYALHVWDLVGTLCVCVCKLGHDVGGGGRGVLILERQVGTRF